MTDLVDHREADDLHLSPVGRGRFRRSRNRVRGNPPHEDCSIRSIISRTPSIFSYTSVFVTRTTWKPNDSKMCIRSSSRAISAAVEWVVPSTSTTSFPSSVTKSTTYRSIECWRRNFQCASFLARNSFHKRASALVCDDRSRRALCLNRSIPLTRPLRGRPLPNGERCSTGGRAA